jgi:hypothetical protein
LLDLQPAVNSARDIPSGTAPGEHFPSLVEGGQFVVLDHVVRRER